MSATDAAVLQSAVDPSQLVIDIYGGCLIISQVAWDKDKYFVNFGLPADNSFEMYGTYADSCAECVPGALEKVQAHIIRALAEGRLVLAKAEVTA